jgi:hypothetical protein
VQFNSVLPYFSDDFTANCTETTTLFRNVGRRSRCRGAVPHKMGDNCTAATDSYLVHNQLPWSLAFKITDRYIIDEFVVCPSEYQTPSKPNKEFHRWMQYNSDLSLDHTSFIPWSMEFRIPPLWARRFVVVAAICCRSSGSTCRCAAQCQWLVSALTRWTTFPPDRQCRLHYNLVERLTERSWKDETNT